MHNRMEIEDFELGEYYIRIHVGTEVHYECIFKSDSLVELQSKSGVIYI